MAATGAESSSASADDVATAPIGRLTAVVTARLASAGVPSPDVDARWLVEAATHGVGGAGVDRDRLEALVARRVAREPLQVILGTAAFRHVTLHTRSGVFVPRPETEIVAGVAIEAALAVPSPPARVVDACTGSGTIALAVASEVPGVRVVATEVDEAALDLARHNLRALQARTPSPDQPWRPGNRLAPAASVEVVAGDLLEGVDASWRGRVDVLVANPPYLPAADRGSWEPEVARHDPDRSLVGGADGHEVVGGLLALAGEWLRPRGLVVIEIDDRRGADALAAARGVGLVECRLVADLTGRDRAVAGSRP